MEVRACVCEHACMGVRAYVGCVLVCASMCACVCEHACVVVRTCVCEHACMLVCEHARGGACLCASMRVGVRACVCDHAYEEEEEEICLFNMVCSYTNSAM